MPDKYGFETAGDREQQQQDRRAAEQQQQIEEALAYQRQYDYANAQAELIEDILEHFRRAMQFPTDRRVERDGTGWYIGYHNAPADYIPVRLDVSEVNVDGTAWLQLHVRSQDVHKPENAGALALVLNERAGAGVRLLEGTGSKRGTLLPVQTWAPRQEAAE